MKTFKKRSFLIWLITLIVFFVIVFSTNGVISDLWFLVLSIDFIVGVVAFAILVFDILHVRSGTDQIIITTFKSIRKYRLPLLALLTIFLVFYWFQWRPSEIRKGCHEIAKEKANKVLYERAEIEESEYQKGRLLKVADQGLHYQEDYDKYYENCLHEKGLK